MGNKQLKTKESEEKGNNYVEPKIFPDEVKEKRKGSAI